MTIGKTAIIPVSEGCPSKLKPTDICVNKPFNAVLKDFNDDIEDDDDNICQILVYQRSRKYLIKVQILTAGTVFHSNLLHVTLLTFRCCYYVSWDETWISLFEFLYTLTDL